MKACIKSILLKYNIIDNLEKFVEGLNMIEINKKVIINNSLSSCDIDKDNSLILHLNTCEKYLVSKNNKSLKSPKITELKLGDSIKINLKFINQSSLDIEKLKLNFNSCNNFKFVSNSLINIDTKEIYHSECINSNCFSISSLKINESINLRFFIKVSSTNANDIDFNNIYNLMTLTKQNYLSDFNSDSLFLIKQASLQITENPLNGFIDIENLGTAPALDVIYTFNIPKNAVADFSNVEAYLNNNAVKINYKKLNNVIFFKLPTIPEINNNKISKLRIKFNCHNKNSIYISKMTLK